MQTRRTQSVRKQAQ